MRRRARHLTVPFAPFVGALDAFTSGLWSCGGIKRLLQSHTGPLIQVRRSSDNATMDVGFATGGALDTASMLAWSGSDSVYVARVYDQSGAGNHHDALTLSEQPRIVNAGVYDGFIRFDGADDGIQSVNNGGATAAKSYFRNANVRSWIGVTNILSEYGDGKTIGASPASQMATQEFSVNNSWLNVYLGNASAASSYSQTGTLSYGGSGSFGYVWTPNGSYTGIRMYTGGAQISPTPSETGDPGSGSSNTSFASLKWGIGKRRADNLASTLDLYWFAIYDADKSTDAGAITTALA